MPTTSARGLGVLLLFGLGWGGGLFAHPRFLHRIAAWLTFFSRPSHEILGFLPLSMFIADGNARNIVNTREQKSSCSLFVAREFQ